MFEAGITFGICLVESIAGSIYTDKFLKGKMQRKAVLPAWTFLYFILESLAGGRISSACPLGSIVKVSADIWIVLFLQMAFYQRDLPKQFFVAASFAGGKEMILYIITVLYISLNKAGWRIFDVFLKKGRMNSMDMVRNWTAVSNGIIWTVIILLYALLLNSYLFIMSAKFVKKNYRLQKHENAFLMLPCISALCISITLKMMILSVEKGVSATIFDKVPAALFWVPFICLLLLSVNISSVTLFQKLVLLNEEERKRSILENEMRQMQREIAEIQDIYADMRGLRHDMRSHLESIAAVIGRNGGKEREELEHYIGKMEETVSRLDFSYQTGNPITDVILHQKKQEAQKQGISFQADFTYPGKKQIDVYDIGIVLNNALENAMEAVSKMEGKKEIRVRSYQKGSLFFLEVVNDFSGRLAMDRETGLPVSSKEDGQRHGLGMENIQRCARKYRGDLDISIQETEGGKKFILTVMMYELFTPKMP